MSPWNCSNPLLEVNDDPSDCRSDGGDRHFPLEGCCPALPYYADESCTRVLRGSIEAYYVLENYKLDLERHRLLSRCEIEISR